MITEKEKMRRYMVAEELAFKTIEKYSTVYDKIKRELNELLNRGNFFWVDYLASIEVAAYRNSVRSVVLKLCRDTYGEDLKLPTVHVPFKLQPIYDIDEVSKIFSKITNLKHIAISRLLFTESLRIDEVLSIKLCDCNKKEGSVIIRGTKNDRDYKKFFDKTTIEALRNYLRWAKDVGEYPKLLLFEGKGKTSCKYSQTSVRMFLKKAMKKADIEIKGACHIFRRSASVWKAENSWKSNEIAASLNNSVRSCEKYYAYVRQEYLDRLPKPIPQPASL